MLDNGSTRKRIGILTSSWTKSRLEVIVNAIAQPVEFVKVLRKRILWIITMTIIQELVGCRHQLKKERVINKLDHRVKRKLEKSY